MVHRPPLHIRLSLTSRLRNFFSSLDIRHLANRFDMKIISSLISSGVFTFTKFIYLLWTFPEKVDRWIYDFVMSLIVAVNYFALYLRRQFFFFLLVLALKWWCSFSFFKHLSRSHCGQVSFLISDEGCDENWNRFYKKPLYFYTIFIVAVELAAQWAFGLGIHCVSTLYNCRLYVYLQILLRDTQKVQILCFRYYSRY